MNMNILVTGANGQLGREMRLIAQDTPYHFIFTDVVEAEGVETTLLDITSLEAVKQLVKAHDIHCIVNCAAYTNVDKAESDEAFCRVLNAEAPRNLAEAMKEVNGLLIHISTDYVFGGDPYNIPCREDQKGTPTGAYGRTKLEGEKYIQATGCDYVILRTAWLYSTFGNNFVKTMRRLGAERENLTVVFDQIGTPTYARDLAEAIVAMLPKLKTGVKEVYHFSNEGVCSWYDFAVEIMKLSGLKCKVKPIESKDYPTPAKRPFYSVLNKGKIKADFGLEIRHWSESVRDCVEKLNNGL